MAERGRHLAVGRLRKPHGLKGDVAVFPLTDAPDEVFAAGREVWIMNLHGELVAGPVTVERSRSYHREWLVKLAGLDGRDALDPWRDHLLAVPEDVLAPPEGNEVWLHELAGFTVRGVDGEPLGVVSDVLELPAGVVIEVQGPRREFLLPYRSEFVTEVDRAARRLTVAPPAGLLDV